MNVDPSACQVGALPLSYGLLPQPLTGLHKDALSTLKISLVWPVSLLRQDGVDIGFSKGSRNIYRATLYRSLPPPPPPPPPQQGDSSWTVMLYLASIVNMDKAQVGLKMVSRWPCNPASTWRWTVGI